MSPDFTQLSRRAKKTIAKNNAIHTEIITHRDILPELIKQIDFLWLVLITPLVKDKELHKKNILKNLIDCLKDRHILSENAIAKFVDITFAGIEATGAERALNDLIEFVSRHGYAFEFALGTTLIITEDKLIKGKFCTKANSKAYFDHDTINKLQNQLRLKDKTEPSATIIKREALNYKLSEPKILGYLTYKILCCFLIDQIRKSNGKSGIIEHSANIFMDFASYDGSQADTFKAIAGYIFLYGVIKLCLNYFKIATFTMSHQPKINNINQKFHTDFADSFKLMLLDSITHNAQIIDIPVIQFEYWPTVSIAAAPDKPNEDAEIKSDKLPKRFRNKQATLNTDLEEVKEEEAVIEPPVHRRGYVYLGAPIVHHIPRHIHLKDTRDATRRFHNPIPADRWETFAQSAREGNITNDPHKGYELFPKGGNPDRAYAFPRLAIGRNLYIGFYKHNPHLGGEGYTNFNVPATDVDYVEENYPAPTR